MKMTDTDNNNSDVPSGADENSAPAVEPQENQNSETIIRERVSATGYAGDVTAPDAFTALTEGALIVDVRTVAEWNYVGIPALSPDQMALCEWQTYPSMQQNPEFVAKLSEEILSRSNASSVVDAPPIYFLCRSGVRSRSAAIAMTQAGFPKCFNIKNGFEGDPDADGHRGTVNGWKVDGLPWRQG